MIEVYHEIGPDTEAAILVKAYEDAAAIFMLHVHKCRQLIGELLGIDVDKEKLLVSHNQDEGITHFTYAGYLNDIKEFNKECGNIFVDVQGKAFTWEKDIVKSQNEAIAQTLNETIIGVKHPPQSMLWPLLGRTAFTMCPGPEGAIKAPGIIVNSGKVRYIVGNEYTLYGKKGHKLPLMEGIRQIDPLLIIEEMLAEYKSEQEKNMSIEFKEAAAFVMHFGKYAGKSLDHIAEDDLDYLVWLYEKRKKDGDDQVLDRFLNDYLNDPTIAKDWQ